MKSLKVFMIMAFAVALTTTVSAQGTKLWLRDVKGKLINYGSQVITSTTDSALNVVDTLPIANNSAGILQVTVVGTDSLGNGVTGRIIYRYHKSAGTLTLASGANVSAAVTDTGLGTSTFTFTATSYNNVQLKLKGKLGYTVRWRTLIQQIYP